MSAESGGSPPDALREARLTEIRERVEKATRGPWWLWSRTDNAVPPDGHHPDHAVGFCGIGSQFDHTNAVMPQGHGMVYLKPADADFILNAVEDMRYLLSVPAPTRGEPGGEALCSEISRIIGAALSGDTEVYRSGGLHGGSFIRWRRVESDIHAAVKAALPARPVPPEERAMGFSDVTMRTERDFGYLLNAMERAAQADNPAQEGYAEKRRDVLRFVHDLVLAALRPPTDEGRET